MNEQEHKNLEELLSSYIDGELSERQCNEVKRLVANNEGAARLLKDLQKYRTLLGSLPRAHAPAHLVENVRASLERSVLLDEYRGKAGGKAGVVHLYVRKMVAAAAMIALVGLLGIVVYNIVKPEAKPTAEVAKVLPAAAAQPAKMELNLQTGEATAVNAFIYRNIILDNGLQDRFNVDRLADRNVYSISCSRARAEMVLEELGTIWNKFKATQLSIDGADLPIANVTPAQAIQIAKETSGQKQIELAKDFAASNKLAADQPVEETVASADGKTKEDIIITKPALTSGEKKPAPNEPADAKEITLTIIVTGQ